ncbi:MAG: hypothetical protein IJ207_02760 [Treponema sp.]|uniref:hypothetical protein n=1 Tax=Treponema sp. TaxID=166 RepID=UPI0025E1BD06|nr:hypothetical protein [Treponema sp.]MBQ9281101.1 hypothetical protein [Treponema sp.]
MKKIIFTVLALWGAFSAFSDDGGSWYPEDWTYGNIYVKEPNDKIALEKELMIVEQSSKSSYDEKTNTRTKLHGSEVEAIFGFKNTTAQSVVVPCAFPVVVSTQVAVKKDGFLSNYIEVGNGYSSKLEVLEVALGRKLRFKEADWESGERRWGTTDATKNDLLSVDKKLRTVPIAEYLSELKNYKASETLSPCQIVQDGKKIAVQTVGIETAIEKHDENTESLKETAYREHNQVEVYTIKVVLHFFHELTFKPAASSKLSVKYAIDAAKGGRSYRHSFVYDISTGGTWKGDIKSFVVLTDSSMDIKNSKTKFEITDLGEMCNWKRTYLYCAENYKPQKDEYFVFDLNSYGYECDVWLSNRKSMQDFVSGVRSSSELSGSYKISSDNQDGEDGNLVPSTYEAKTSFDGNLLNGWVEGVKGDGIGEWIEFTLSKNVLGPFATNGLRRFGGSLKSEYYDENESVYKTIHGTNSSWESNNRVKSMILSSEGKNIAELQFEDKCLEVLTSPADWIWQSAIKNPQLLKTGTYRMTINSVYKGKKWDDTVLGEVWFVPIEDKAGNIILNDDFFKKPILQKTRQFLSLK